MSNHIKEMIAPLTPVRLGKIKQPKTLEEGRLNLKRFYGCVDGCLVVMLKSHNLTGERFTCSGGERVNGHWKHSSCCHRSCSEPHVAIKRLIPLGQRVTLVFIDVEQMNSLDDLYKIKVSEMVDRAHDPSFTMNLIENLEAPLVENDDGYTDDLNTFLKTCYARKGGMNIDNAWLNDEKSYGIFSNDDPALKDIGGFYNFSVVESFDWRWRQMNNRHTRYLHWLLLGPFAPYQYSGAGEDIAA